MKGLPLAEPWFTVEDGKPMMCDENGEWYPAERFSVVQPGDILWVRETWAKDVGRYMYRANYSDTEKFYMNGREIRTEANKMITNQDKINALFEELVPASGKADSLAGELVRATSRIGYRFYNDGDQLGVGYGKETCNPAGRFLIKKAPKEIGDLVAALWGMYSEDGYEAVLDVLVGKVADYVDANPDLRSQPTEDMFDYYDKYEDVDDSWEDDEDDEDDDYYEDEDDDWE